MRLQLTMVTLGALCIGITQVDAARPKHRRMRARVHHNAWYGKPYVENPVYEALNGSNVSEFGRLLRDYDVLKDVSEPITIFAPRNAELNTDKVRRMSKENITYKLNTHIVPGYIMPTSIYDGAELKSVSGNELNWERDDETMMVEGAEIRDWYMTPHAMIYVIDRPLHDDD